MAEDESQDATTRQRWEFTPDQLDRTVIAIPLLRALDAETKPEPHAVVMEINLEHPERRAATLKAAEDLVSDAIQREGEVLKPSSRSQYLYARLYGDTIRKIVAANEDRERPIYRIWPDFPIGPL